MTTDEKIAYARKRRNALLERHTKYIEMCRNEFLEFARKTPALQEYVNTGVQPTDPGIVSVIKERWEAILRDKVQVFNQKFFIEWAAMTVLETIPELIPLPDNITEEIPNE